MRLDPAKVNAAPLIWALHASSKDREIVSDMKQSPVKELIAFEGFEEMNI